MILELNNHLRKMMASHCYCYQVVKAVVSADISWVVVVVVVVVEVVLEEALALELISQDSDFPKDLHVLCVLSWPHSIPKDWLGLL